MRYCFPLSRLVLRWCADMRARRVCTFEVTSPAPDLSNPYGSHRLLEANFRVLLCSCAAEAWDLRLMLVGVDAD